MTEHRLRVYLTADGERYVADIGDILNRPIFGPRLLAMIGWMKSAAHCSYSTIETYMEDVLQVPVSRGYLNFDYSSANCSFAWNYWIKAQYCWAHLIRDIRFLKKLPDEKTKVWAEQLEDRSRRLFQAWHDHDEMTDEGFRRSMMIHRDLFLELARNPPSSKEANNLAARFAIREYVVEGSDEVQSYDMSQDYFRFMFADGVEPTNNHNEQQIRHCVIDRMITQGTRSEAGQRYHERMWTALATCRKQQRNFFDFLKASIEAKLNKKPAPSLLHG